MPAAISLHWGALLVTVLLYGLVFGVGARAGRRGGGDSADIMLAGRRLPVWLGVFTMSATWVGGGYVNGSAEAAYSSGLAWVQAPWGYALSLVVGGLVYARTMREHGFTTMLDPLQLRFGRRVAALLYLPALSGEIFWSGAVLTALGTTFATVVGVDTRTAIVLSAAVAIGYTLVGGLWSVAVTDVVQLVLLLGGLWLVVPQAAASVGGLEAAWAGYAESGIGTSLLPPWAAWSDPSWGATTWLWWDSALLLILGGIPWHVYFQRVLATPDARTATRLSLLAAVVCLLAAVPAVLVGVIGRSADWTAIGVAPPEPALVLPWVLRYLTGPWTAAIGLGAIAAAVMSSVDSSILSAASMGAWNVYRPLVRPELSGPGLVRAVRTGVLLVGVGATFVAIRVQSVYALWFLCSDLVYCVLFPQLTAALFSRRANRSGAVAGLAVSFVLRAGGGEPVLGLPRLLPYPMVDPASGAVLFPFRTLAMLAGLATILVVSRLTAQIDPPAPLPVPAPEPTTTG